jgi:DNA-nicking Smr family endonuclease
MKPSPPDPTLNDDRAAWRRFAGSVRPLGAPARGPARLAASPAACPPVLPEPVRAPPRRSSKPLAPLAIGTAPPGLDRSSWRRLSGGRSRPARRLDLHGLTAARALAALEAFLEAASADGERTVEVITGRGTGAEGGVIRREFAHWLNLPSLRPLLLGASHPHPANPGAVLLLLRRKR